MKSPCPPGSFVPLLLGGVVLVGLAAGCDLEPRAETLVFHGRDPAAWPGDCARRLEPFKALAEHPTRMSFGWAEMRPVGDPRPPVPISSGFGFHHARDGLRPLEASRVGELWILLMDFASYAPYVGSGLSASAPRRVLLVVEAGEAALGVLIDPQTGAVEFETGTGAAAERFVLTEGSRERLARLGLW